MRQKYEENNRIQKSCAQYMDKFIGKFSSDIRRIEFILFSHILERLQDQVCELKLPNEDELFIQISGLKQVCADL